MTEFYWNQSGISIWLQHSLSIVTRSACSITNAHWTWHACTTNYLNLFHILSIKAFTRKFLMMKYRSKTWTIFGNNVFLFQFPHLFFSSSTLYTFSPFPRILSCSAFHILYTRIEKRPYHSGCFDFKHLQLSRIYCEYLLTIYE